MRGAPEARAWKARPNTERVREARPRALTDDDEVFFLFCHVHVRKELEAVCLGSAVDATLAPTAKPRSAFGVAPSLRQLLLRQPTHTMGTPQRVPKPTHTTETPGGDPEAGSRSCCRRRVETPSTEPRGVFGPVPSAAAAS